jgi:hypothetical protein
MDAMQAWCLQCGVGAPDSLTKRSPSWRSTATVLGATAILAVGAGTAAYAALSKATATARRATATVAQTPAPTAATPVTPTTPPPATAKTATPKAAKSIFPAGTIKPPKIPLTPATTPKSTTTPTTTTPTTTTPKTTTEKLPTPLLLDTNAVATYNPYGYPASRFGDPTLTIDGDTSTGWTARLDPAVAPKLAEGLVVDLKAAQKLSELALVTSTPGMAIQVFGTKASVLPPSITDPAWIQLSPYRVEPKRHALLKLRESTKAFDFVTLWISKAPASSIGTPQAPGLVSVNEIELFPTK